MNKDHKFTSPIVRIHLIAEQQLTHKHEYIYGHIEAAPIFIEKLSTLSQEYLALLCLDSHYRLISYSEIAKGSMTQVKIDYNTIFKTILLSNASAIFIGHNHPSGVLIPSESDISSLRNLNSLCKIFDIELIDSIVVSPSGDYLSLREELRNNSRLKEM